MCLVLTLNSPRRRALHHAGQAPPPCTRAMLQSLTSTSASKRRSPILSWCGHCPQNPPRQLQTRSMLKCFAVHAQLHAYLIDIFIFAQTSDAFVCLQLPRTQLPQLLPAAQPLMELLVETTSSPAPQVRGPATVLALWAGVGAGSRRHATLVCRLTRAAKPTLMLAAGTKAHAVPAGRRGRAIAGRTRQCPLRTRLFHQPR